MTTFERIQKLSKQRGMSLRKVAEEANLGETTIYGWKNRTPDSSNLQAVATVLGVTIDYLLGKNDTPDWANEKDTHDLKEFLDNNADSMTFEGEGLTEVEKEKLKIAMTQIFWDRHKHN